jgi:hypothetical protein
MKPHLLLALAVAAGLVPFVGHGGAMGPLTVAILDFESRDEPLRDAGAQATTLINAALSTEADLILVERAELQKILGEQELGLSGNVSSDTAAKVGQLTGAKVLVTGRVFKADKELVMVAKIIGTETSRVYGEMVKAVGKPVTDLSTELAQKIAKTIIDRADTLVAKVRTREDRIQAIKQALKKDRLPAVSVKLPERHFGGPTFDPAAETELGKILTECGFTLVDDKSARKADLEFTGEAFSEFGVRRGNLVSCKARVELKVRDVGTGQILFVDRQTTVAVDLSEQVAAKTALQEASGALAERLLSKVVK